MVKVAVTMDLLRVGSATLVDVVFGSWIVFVLGVDVLATVIGVLVVFIVVAVGVEVLGVKLKAVFVVLVVAMLV